jgi:hypothetical protein
MTFSLPRHTAPAALVVMAVCLTAVALLLLRPSGNPGAEVHVPNLAPGHHFNAAHVRNAFAAHGLHLRFSTPLTWGVTLSTTRPPFSDDTLYVMVEKGDRPPAWNVPTHDIEIGNLDIHYGGASEHVRTSVQAAVNALRRAA